LEKQADIIIADHARRNAPPGSISWKFIQQSVAKGELEDIEDHRAGPPVGTIRAVGSAQPTKKGKTPFTAEDDRILMEWCTKAERKGLPLKGNEIYKQLEAKVRFSAEIYWRNMLTYGCRIAGTLSSHGEITGSKTFLIDRDLRYLKLAEMKMMRTNLPKTTAQSLDNPCGSNLWPKWLKHTEMLLQQVRQPAEFPKAGT
jgi:hypothetical protein